MCGHPIGLDKGAKYVLIMAQIEDILGPET